MQYSVRSLRGMVTSPHHLASQAGLDVLKDGGTAAEAAVTVAATLAVVYPHMTGIGGDSFWLVREPNGHVHAIHGVGGAAQAATLELYAGMAGVPVRGALAANTVAGTVSAWETLLEGARLPLSRLLRDAIDYAEAGVPITKSGADTVAAKGAELRAQPGAWAQIFDRMAERDVLKQPALAGTLRALAEDGLDGFYRGSLAERIAADLQRLGSPVSAADFAAHCAEHPKPLSFKSQIGTLYNSAPPTQGLASLLILAIAERLAMDGEGWGHVHGLVEATKQAFLVRDAHVGDPAYMTLDPQALLDDSAAIGAMAAKIGPGALPWPQPASAGDTCWFAAADAEGRVVSAIQSIYHEFGSGVVLPETGIIWQNRGMSFRLAETGWNALRPGRKPFHTLNPAMASFEDGRMMAYGTMGGEGQPQTQAAIFTRYVRFGVNIQEAISCPRWLLGRTWGEESTTLKIERGFAPDVYDQLRAVGHAVEIVPYLSQAMGHAGAIVRHPGGVLEGATDPRSDGQVAAW
jgi:gamma-glutamyltranspeptidase/glutathione hydrolase